MRIRVMGGEGLRVIGDEIGGKIRVFGIVDIETFKNFDVSIY
jgi:hypothetical protein